MSLPLLPYVQTSSGKQLLDGRVYEDLSHEQQRRRLHLIASMYPSPET